MSGDGNLFIDDDWKNQAEREKEALAEEMQAEGGPGEMPEASFLGHIESLAMQVMMSLGLMEYPGAQGKRYLDPVQAKYLIDLIDLLAKKTEGNRDEEENEYLKRMLPDLKMAYVEVMNAVARSQAQGAAKQAGAAPSGGAAAGSASSSGIILDE